MSSEQFVRKQVQEKNDGGIPLFFLDSHWYDYWPLGDEVKAIAESGVRSVTIIDDFQVPDRPEFGYEVGTSNGDQVCGMDMIVPSLSTSRSNLYGFLLPSYSFEDAFPTDRRGSLRGHIVIFQNLMVRFHCFLGLSFVKGYYDRYECFDGMC